MLAPIKNAYWTVISWLNGDSATQGIERAEGWRQMPGLLGSVTGEAGERAMTTKVRLNYLGVDLIAMEPVGVCRGKAVHLPQRAGAKASCKRLPPCWPDKCVSRSFEATDCVRFLSKEDGGC